MIREPRKRRARALMMDSEIDIQGALVGNLIELLKMEGLMDN